MSEKEHKKVICKLYPDKCSLHKEDHCEKDVYCPLEDKTMARGIKK